MVDAAAACRFVLRSILRRGILLLIRMDVLLEALSALLFICGTFNKFPDFFVQTFKMVIDSRKFSMLLLYIFMISCSNEQLQ